jgi:uncharacterized protein
MSRVLVVKSDNGSWSIAENDFIMIDFGPVEGTWVNCFGSVSPWKTPLSSEELYFDDTSQWNNPEFEDYNSRATLVRQLGCYPNPYDYGFNVEITEPTSHNPAPVKHLAMGRYSHENSVVMPDEKTVYLSDDGTGGVFFKFVADQPGDLSSGTLYAAKMTQDEGKDPATTGFDIHWMELAHGSNSEIGSWIDEYDGLEPRDYVAGATSYIPDDAEVKAWADREAKDDRAAFLETRKAAAAKGATVEFRHMEGVMINYAAVADHSVPLMYMAMSEVGKTMSDDEGDVRLNENLCGVVYEMPLGQDYNVTRMEPAVAGFGQPICRDQPVRRGRHRQPRQPARAARRPGAHWRGHQTTRKQHAVGLGSDSRGELNRRRRRNLFELMDQASAPTWPRTAASLGHPPRLAGSGRRNRERPRR